MKRKLKTLSERNALEQFLFNNVEHVCREESFNAVELASQLQIPIHKIREWARISPYTSYCRGGFHFQAVILVDTELLKATADEMILQAAEEEKNRQAEAYAASYVRQVVVGDINAAMLLLQSVLGLSSISDSLRALVSKAYTAVEKSHAEAIKGT